MWRRKGRKTILEGKPGIIHNRYPQAARVKISSEAILDTNSL
jgi:hypothetical protein